MCLSEVNNVILAMVKSSFIYVVNVQLLVYGFFMCLTSELFIIL